MFPIFTTAMAIFLCLIGSDLDPEDGPLSLLACAILFLAVIPTGEFLVLLARVRARAFPARGLKLAVFFFSSYGILAFAAAIFFFGWGRLPERIGLKGWVLLDTGLLVASYLVLANLCRLYRIRFFRAMGRMPGRAGRASFNMALRGELTIVIPFLIFVLFSDLLSVNEKVHQYVTFLPVLFWCALFLLFLLIAQGLPRLIRFLWKLEPLPEHSPLRRALFQFMDRQEFKVRDILIWPTHRMFVNAALLGFTPGSRYIVFTDAMVQNFSLPELESVLAHELGHGKHRHIQIYMIFSIAFIFGLSLVENLIPPLAGLEEELRYSLFMVGPAVLLYWWLVFGFLSRRFEMEADIFGAVAVNDPLLFMETLDKVARVGGVEKRKSSWRHFSINRRIASLRKVFFDEPETGERFFNRMKKVRVGIIAFSLVLSLLFAADLVLDTVAGVGLIALEEEDYDKAEAILEEVSRMPGGGMYRWSLLELYLKNEELDEASNLLFALTQNMESGSAPDGVCVLFIETGLSHLLEGSLEISQKHMARALELFPNNLELITLQKYARQYDQGNTDPLKAWIEKKRDQEKEKRGEEIHLWRHL